MIELLDQKRSRSVLRHAIWAAGAAIIASLAAIGCSEQKKPVVLTPRYATLPAKVVPEYMRGTIFERVDVTNTDPLSVNNFGLVTNLPARTGDAMTVKTSIREYILKEMGKAGFGSTRLPGYEKLSAEEMLKDPRNAIVRVDALMPAGARKGQHFDIAVSVLNQNNTSSLADGDLYQTDLKINGANPDYPGVVLTNEGSGSGQIFVNPAYSLTDPNDPAARASLRFGTVLGGGHVMKDRAILFRIRQPQLSMSRQIEYRIKDHFHDSSVAAAFDEGIVQAYVPYSFNGDWEHFVGVVTHLNFNSSPEFATGRARLLADEAVKPDALLKDISYCWEALGQQALPTIIPLMNSESSDVAYAAARAAAFLGESSAINVLVHIAKAADNPFQINAVQTLGALPPSPVVSQMLRELLNSRQNTVRIEAYKLLVAMDDPSVFSKPIGDGKFTLDIIRSSGTPLIYAWRRDQRRLAIFGDKPSLGLPAAFSAINNKLTITSNAGDRTVKIFCRDNGRLRFVDADKTMPRPAVVLSNPDVAEIVARLAGEGAGDAKQRLAFSYGDIVAVVQSMTSQQQVYALIGDKRMPTSFVLQTLPRVDSSIDDAPTIPDPNQARPQGEEEGPKVGLAR